MRASKVQNQDDFRMNEVGEDNAMGMDEKEEAKDEEDNDNEDVDTDKKEGEEEDDENADEGEGVEEDDENTDEEEGEEEDEGDDEEEEEENDGDDDDVESEGESEDGSTLSQGDILNITALCHRDASVLHVEIHAHKLEATSSLNTNDEIRIAVQAQDLDVLPSKRSLHITWNLTKANGISIAATTQLVRSL